jgi:hypothetical protein
VKALTSPSPLCILGELADVMWVMDHQAGAPSVRCVCLADFAHHFEPSLEAKAITSEPRRDENAGDASGEQRVNRFTRHCPRLFRCRLSVRGSGQGSRHASSPCYLYSRSPLLPPSLPRCIARILAVGTASCSRPHVYKNSATSDMIRRIRWPGSRLMAMSERLADARQPPPLVRHGPDGFIHCARINSRPPTRARPD